MNAAPENPLGLITADRFTPALTFKIAADREGILLRAAKAASWPLLTMHYNNALSRLVTGLRCTIYVGDYPDYDGSYASTHSKPVATFIEIKAVDRPITTPNAAHQLLSEQKGYGSDFDVTMTTNPQGVLLATGNFMWTGGKSYQYLIVMGDHPLLIANADWIDRDSIVLAH